MKQKPCKESKKMKSKIVTINKKTCVEFKLDESKQSDTNGKMTFHSMTINACAYGCPAFTSKLEFSEIKPEDLRNLANELNRLSFELEKKIENEAQSEIYK